jgi:hypothetical protein
MQINKILIIESPIHLWRLLRTKEEIIDTAKEDIINELRYFMDCVATYINGCKCDQDENYKEMISQFECIKIDQVVEHLIKGFECDKIEFKNN